MTIRPAPPKITLDRVRPTVVRRRVYENPPAGGGGGFVEEYDGDESGPPSSVNVARALASLRGSELRRLDEILTRDDEVAPAAPALVPAPPPPEPVVPAVPTVRVGSSIALVELARRMSISQEELVTALVTRGFFDVTVKAVLPRETAHATAAMFGWKVEDTDEAPPPPERAPREAKARSAKLAKPAKPAARTKAKGAKAKSAAPDKPAKPKAAKTRNAPAPKPRARPKPKAKPRPATSGARHTSRRA